MIHRQISAVIKEDSAVYPVFGICGPRQSGKTTLAQNLFPEKRYVNLEDPEQRDYAEQDPKGFLEDRSRGIVIDEFQRVPALLSYIRTLCDKEKKPGQYVLTGSQNFFMMERISQSLAGRISLFTLLPLSLSEIYRNGKKLPRIWELLFRGFFPRL